MHTASPALLHNSGTVPSDLAMHTHTHECIHTKAIVKEQKQKKNIYTQRRRVSTWKKKNANQTRTNRV